MSYLLKILKGANAGAEIALAEGAVTFGSGDACDIVLADGENYIQSVVPCATAHATDRHGKITLE